MNHILPHLYLGAFTDAEGATRETLAPCTAILTLCEVAPVHALPGVHYPIPDEVYLPPPAWATAALLVQEWLAAGETVLVHCRLGVSRAPAVVAAYLVKSGYSPTLAHALSFLRTVRPIVNVHPETYRGVEAWLQGKEE